MTTWRYREARERDRRLREGLASETTLRRECPTEVDRARLVEQVERLRPYLGHRADCELRTRLPGWKVAGLRLASSKPYREPVCNCGLADRLRELEG